MLRVPIPAWGRYRPTLAFSLPWGPGDGWGFGAGECRFSSDCTPIRPGTGTQALWGANEDLGPGKTNRCMNRCEEIRGKRSGKGWGEWDDAMMRHLLEAYSRRAGLEGEEHAN